jgi:hypothetical protein
MKHPARFDCDFCSNRASVFIAGCGHLKKTPEAVTKATRGKGTTPGG